ncbi:MAG: aconitate hydratase [Planctomycetota bacterium]
MKQNLVQKILAGHLVSGEMVPGGEIGIRIDQTLTQDATGTMAYLQFEAMGLKKVKTELSVSYADHNTLQTGYENPDDHLYLQSVAAKYGILFSRPGNGICHQVHLERFSRPGRTLLGSDSHTPTGGGAGMIAIGAGGIDVAVAMGGGAFFLPTPKVVNVVLTGKLKPWVTAKDVILEMLRRLTVKGGVGKIYEYGGPGVKTLSVPERATITNMGAELGATTSLFPSDAVTKKFFAAQGRLKDWKELKADAGAEYDEVVEINLSKLVPLIACPHSPGNVKTVKEVEGTPVDQVAIGSCTNSSYIDLMTAAKILRGKQIPPTVSLGISPGSRQVALMTAKSGAIADLVAAGARLLENTCGPCIGMGFAPPSDGVSLRTFNRNFEGRSGTKSAGTYLCSVETAAASALKGKITDPRKLGKTAPKIAMPKNFLIDDSMILKPSRSPSKVKIRRGPNIVALPARSQMPDTLEGPVLIKVGDDITTDHIMPAGAKILPLRSNIPKISEHVFEQVDAEFPKRAKESGGGFILGGSNYGQGSSREHAALAPMFLGVKAVIVKSFARIHLANLVNFGILPLTLDDPKDYDKIKFGDKLRIENVRRGIQEGETLVVENVAGGAKFKVRHPLTDRSIDIMLAGGLLNYTKTQAK